MQTHGNRYNDYDSWQRTQVKLVRLKTIVTLLANFVKKCGATHAGGSLTMADPPDAWQGYKSPYLRPWSVQRPTTQLLRSSWPE